MNSSDKILAIVDPEDIFVRKQLKGKVKIVVNKINLIDKVLRSNG